MYAADTLSQAHLATSHDTDPELASKCEKESTVRTGHGNRSRATTSQSTNRNGLASKD